MSQIHKPSTKPGTVFALEGTYFHWCRYGSSYAICTSRGDLAVLPESGQVVKVIRASGQTEWVKIGPLLKRESGRFIFEHTGPAFSPVDAGKEQQLEQQAMCPNHTPLDAFYDDIEVTTL